MMRSRIYCALALSCTLLVPGLAAAAADNYPSKTIRFLVGFTAGSSTDTVARILAEDLRTRLGQTVIVENRAGANGMLAATAVATAEPDGHTILVSNASSMTVNPLLMKDIKYHPLQDLSPVTNVVSSPFILAINPANKRTSEVKEFKDLIALAKSKPDAVVYGTAGTGNLTHISFELLSSIAGIKMLGVPYRGAAAAQTALLGSEVDAVFDTPTSVPLIKAGNMKALAVSSGTRWRDLPDVPTVAESGYPDFVTSFWTAIVATGKTPKPIIDKLYKAIEAAAQEPKTRDLLLAQGDLDIMPPEKFREKIARELELNAKILEKAGIEKQ